MSSKKRKGVSPWCACDHCKVIISQKDTLLHKEKSCPPDFESWLHSFVADHKLYSTVETFQLQDKSLELVPKDTRSDFALMPYHVLQLCEIPIGDPVLIRPFDCEPAVPFVKLAWPIQEKISDLTVSLSKEAVELNSLPPKFQAVVSKLEMKLSVAELVTVICGESDITITDPRNLLSRAQKLSINKIYCIGNKLLVNYYGNKFIFTIVDIKTYSESEEFSCVPFCLIANETKWEMHDDKETGQKARNLLQKLGGVDAIISELKDVISLALNREKSISGLTIPRGVLIFGPMGTGKTTLIEGLAEHFTSNVIRVECSKIFSKFLGETEKELQNCFDRARETTPSMILIDDLDVLCAKSNSSSEHEKRIVATLSMLMDRLNNDSEAATVVLATTSKIHQIDKMLRSPNRFGKDVEIYVPTSPQRLEIMNILMQDIEHGLTETDIKVIADSSHGFVGADLVSLVSRAILKNYKSSQGKEKVSLSDFQWALGKVKPSAMKEIIIEVPNVKWSDIGGQEELKLKLKQSVEWPLKYSQSFEKLGITPPKGLLMFGPPGCSKTMIAKALATESKLNFISVKGPELFSKWVGESERAVRKVFRRARQAAPSIIFFDELDAIGGERNISSGSNVQERVLAQLLTELDGVESLDNVTVIAATNRPDRIDPALLRPGRLDRIVYVPLPDQRTRKEIFCLQLQKTCVNKDVSVDELVEKTEGFSGAEVIAVCREAALKALEEDFEAESVARKHFLEALDIVVPRTPKSLIEIYERYLTK